MLDGWWGCGKTMLKFFPKKIQNKLLLAIVVAVLLPLIGTGLYGNWITSRILQDSAIQNAENETAQQVQHVEGLLYTARQDVRFLSRLSSMRQLVNAPAADCVSVAEDFAAFARAREIYDQIRYIAADGSEIVRVNSVGDDASIVPPEGLQNKAERYYFREGMKLAPGEIFVSAIDLNREHGTIEVPHKPVLRYATPIFDADGNRQGVIVTNILADKLFDFLNVDRIRHGAVFLVNSDGYFLAHPDKSLLFGSPADLDTGIRLHDVFPDNETLVAEVLSGRSGQLITGGHILVYTPIFPEPGRTDRFWVLVHDETPASIFSSVWEFRFTAFSILVIAVVAAMVLAVMLAHNLTAPIHKLKEGVERFGEGELTEPVVVDTDDEIGELAGAFNRMAKTIARYDRQRAYLLEQLISVQEEERRIAAYDIHDGMIQRLIGARLQLSHFIQLRSADSDRAEASLQRAMEHLKTAIVEGRHLIEGLRPPLLDDLGLVAAVQELAQQTADEMDCTLTFENDLGDERLPAVVETTAFRIVQEALSNSRKYSHTTRLRVALARQNGELSITVQDWGIGFDTGCIGAEKRCVGLVGMKERAGLLDGTCLISSTPNVGTSISITLPLDANTSKET